MMKETVRPEVGHIRVGRDRYWGGFCLRVSVGFTPLKQTNEQRSGKDRTHKLVEMRTLWMILKTVHFHTNPSYKIVQL